MNTSPHNKIITRKLSKSNYDRPECTLTDTLQTNASMAEKLKNYERVEDIEDVNNIIKYEPTIYQIDNYDFESNNKTNNLKFNYINSTFENNESPNKENEAINNFNIEQPNDDNILSNNDNMNFKKTISQIQSALEIFKNISFLFIKV